jgi:hypothetical protein
MPKYLAEEGVYHNQLGIFKVVTNQGSGRRYAKKLTKHSDNSFSWEYEQGAVTKLQPQTKLKEEVAAQFGALYGCCMICLRALDNEESIALGIGPVCRSKNF